MKEKDMSRRGFLKTAAAVGAALTLQPAFNKVKAANAALAGDTVAAKNKAMPHRTLGKGKAAFEVSALGFGVMGMTYNRSQYPDKASRIRVIHEAVDRGVTLFDTAIIYGPLHNEEFAGEALAPYKGRVN
ncbi:MAG: aldo/keto reductase, partial [Bacteroides sp.]|nr:aldo/keto reductase [Bacteroides sp.]